MFGFLKSQNTQKIVALFLFLILLAAIPLTVWYGQKQQTNQNHAATSNNSNAHDSCGHLTFVIKDDACGGFFSSANQYQTTVAVTSDTAISNVHFDWGV